VAARLHLILTFSVPKPTDMGAWNKSCIPAFPLFVAISVQNLQLQSFVELSTSSELFFNTLDMAQRG